MPHPKTTLGSLNAGPRAVSRSAPARRASRRSLPSPGAAATLGSVNAGYSYREQVGPDGAGRTVLAHLARRHRHSSEAAWRARIARGEVRLDDAPAEPTVVLRRGQSLVWHRPPWEEPPAPVSFGLLHRDDHLLAVAKPRGLPTLPNGGFLTHTLLHVVRRRWPEATPVHRLGRGTSGVVLLARSSAARRALPAAWREGRVERVYRGLVSGVPTWPELSIDIPIGLVPHPRLGHVHAARADGRRAVTHVRVLRVVPRGAVVEASIATGRPHQIRIHLAAAGHPLVGDLLYAAGGLPGLRPALPGDGGYWLHAHRLRLLHPVTATPLDLECAPPPVLGD
jgi:23S rRNA pseudouridine1911/1915/1917 synthase